MKKETLHPTQPTSTQLHSTQPSSTKKKRKEHTREQLVKSWLENGRPIFAQLKTGIKDGVMYYGTTIFDSGDNPRTAIVTSDRKIYADISVKHAPDNQIKDDFDLHYRFDFEHDVLDCHLSVGVIKEWVEENLQASSLKDIFNDLVQTNKEYMWFPDETAHEFVALDIMSTYWLPCYEAKGRTFLEAEKGSGKTRQSTIYSLLSFNAMMSSDITKSSFFRLMESTVGTLIIDDFDDIGDEQKRDVLQHYKTGYKDSSKSVRTGEAVGGKRKIEAFRNYGHAVLNNTVGLDDISKERSIPLPILKYDGKVTAKILDKKDISWSVKADELYIAGLAYWKEVKKAYDSCSSKLLKARMFEITRPVLALASLIDSSLRERIEVWLSERLKSFQAIDRENDWEWLVVKQFRNQVDGANILVTDLAVELLSSMGVDPSQHDYHKRKHGICVYIGKHFRRLPGVFDIVTINGYNHLKLVSADRLEKWLRTKGLSWVEDSGGKRGVEDTFKSGFTSDLLIKNIANHYTKKGEFMPYEMVKGYFERGCDDWLTNMKRDGRVFEPRPGFVGVLE